MSENEKYELIFDLATRDSRAAVLETNPMLRPEVNAVSTQKWSV